MTLRNDAGMAVATALDGARVPVPMGIGAARFHHVIPREIGTTVIAMSTQRRDMQMTTGRVRLVKRDVCALDAWLKATGLGQILVTTPEQTADDSSPVPNGHHSAGEGMQPSKASTADEYVPLPGARRQETTQRRGPGVRARTRPGDPINARGPARLSSARPQ